MSPKRQCQRTERDTEATATGGKVLASSERMHTLHRIGTDGGGYNRLIVIGHPANPGFGFTC